MSVLLGGVEQYSMHFDFHNNLFKKVYIIKLYSPEMRDKNIIERDLPTGKSENDKGATRYAYGYCVAKVRNK